MLYRAYQLVITARRNEPARYKQLLKYLKFFGLMVTVEGDATYGFTLTLDGPASLFSSNTRYGLAMAKFLPALLHVTKWDLSAALKPRRDLAWVDPKDDEWSFQLTSEDGYVSHYAAEGTRQRPGVGLRRALRQAGHAVAARTGSGPGSGARRRDPARLPAGARRAQRAGGDRGLLATRVPAQEVCAC